MRSFLDEFSQRLGRGPMELCPEALRTLVGRRWPGNVRELRNTLLRVATLAPSDRLTVADLTLLEPGSRESLEAAGGTSAFYDLPLEEVERRHILRTLRRCDGNRSQAARILGINRTTLWKKLTRYGFEQE